MIEYINHSGGCDGADMTWETEGRTYGVKTIAYSFYNHHQKGENPYIMNTNELLEGWEHVKTAAGTLKRPLSFVENNPYVRNLLCRNWFQVKHADAVFAVGKFDGKVKKKVAGGTGWAVQMAIDNDTPIYFFDQPTNAWYVYMHTWKVFIEMYVIPTLTENFAGIGTREINAFGVLAIQKVYEYNLKPVENGENTL